jgi:hypothetical protein
MFGVWQFDLGLFFFFLLMLVAFGVTRWGVHDTRSLRWIACFWEWEMFGGGWRRKIELYCCWTA